MDFVTAFNHTMLYEVGPWWNPSDPDVIAGNTGAPQLDRKVGYTNTPGDRGGLTKYGISQNDNPDVSIAGLNLSAAQQIYMDRYWNTSKCNLITIPVTGFYFDMCVNNGVLRGARILQQAVGAFVDGMIGPRTIALVNQQDPGTLINTLSTLRANRYRAIVANDPSQAKFLNGWLRRNDEVTHFSLARLT